MPRAQSKNANPWGIQRCIFKVGKAGNHWPHPPPPNPTAPPNAYQARAPQHRSRDGTYLPQSRRFAAPMAGSGLFLQERRGNSGEVRYIGGPRQHVLYCFEKTFSSEVSVEDQHRDFVYRKGEGRFYAFRPFGLHFRWSGEVQALMLGIEPWFLQGIKLPSLGVAPGAFQRS